MRIKEYFSDGMLQIAMVLSLLRTDLNNLFNMEYRNYPEVQEIIMGQTSAITQTNFHNYRNHRHGYQVHAKAPDNDINLIIQDLRSLARFNRWQESSSSQRNQRISAFLVGIQQQRQASHTAQQQTEFQNPANGDETNNQTLPESGQNQTEQNHTSSLPFEVIDSEIPGTSSSSIFDITTGPAEQLDNSNVQSSNERTSSDDLTSEDLDLIDVLWRQDIDLGVGKEMFDMNLRKELEREREVELQKNRQKQKDRELLQRKLEEQRLQQQHRWLTENFMQDTETGEWIPLGGRGQSSQTQPPVMPNNQYQNYMPYDNNMPMVNDPMQHQQQQSYLEGDYGMPQHHMNITDQYQNTGQQNNSMMGQTLSPQTLPQTQTMPNYMGDMQQINNTTQNVTNVEPQFQQDSLEERWLDLVNLLELTSNNNASAQNNMTAHNMMNNMTQSMTSSNESVLIQNATLPVATQLNSNFTSLDNSLMAQHSSGRYQSSNSSDGCPTPINWDQNELFSPDNSTSAITEVERILPDIIADQDLDELNITELALSDDLRSMQMLDDSASESGLSMGSSGSPIQAQDQFSDSVSSPFDGLEGATGGQNYSGGSPNYQKANDYEPNKYSNYSSGGDSYSNSGDSYSNGEGSQSNFSSSSNETEFHFHHTKTSHIHHNHSYPLQPGQEPKEHKKYSTANKDHPRHKGPQCKDAKRIQELKVPLSVDEIVDVPVEEFNELLTRHKFTDAQLQLIRDIRRRGKNKVAAQNCRKRKMDVIVTLEDDMQSLKDSRDKLLQERHMIDKQTRDMKDKFSSLYREIFQSLRDEHGMPYDPHHYSLQQSSDGNVFLVPRNVSADEQQAKSSKKKKEKK